MTLTNLPTQLVAALLFSLAYTSLVSAQDAHTNENNHTDQVVSNANPTCDVSGNDKPAVEKQTNISPASPCMKLVSDMEKFQQMEKQWYQQRRDSYRAQQEKRNLQNNVTPDASVESRRNDYIQHMEQRREFFNKLNEKHRKEFEQRREEMQQRMHQTRRHINTTVNA